MRILHILDHGLPLQSGYTFRTRAILKSQMRRADKFKSRFTLIIGGDEMDRGTAPLKNMDAGTQAEVALDAAAILAIIKG